MSTTSYQVTLGERVLRVALRRAGADLFVRLDDGDERPVHLETLHGVQRALAYGDQRVELLANRASEGDVAVTVAGIEYRLGVLDEAHARLASVAGAKQGAHARFELKAPMPGLVVKILCAEGDEVAAGQPLAVLQAMKMENELSLPRPGKVTQVQAEPGQTVEQGQILVVIE